MKPRKSSWFILQALVPLSVPVLILVSDRLGMFKIPGSAAKTGRYIISGGK